MLKTHLLFLGSGLLELKSQLQKRMKVVREVHRKEAEVRHKLENEDFDDEEEEWEEQSDVEEDSSDNDDVIGDKSKRRSGKNVKKNRGNVSLKNGIMWYT